jgi:streptogramin lyase
MSGMRVSVKLSLARRSILMGAALSLLALCTSGASFNCAGAGAELVRLDPGSGDRAGSIEIGDPARIGHLAIGGGNVWLAACGLVQVDIDQAEIVQSNHDPAACGPIAYGAEAVWRVLGRELVKLDPATGEQASARLPGRVNGDVVAEGVDLAAGPEGVFVANPSDGSVTRFDPGLSVIRRVRLPLAGRGYWVRAMAVSTRPGELWVSDEHARSLYSLDPRSLALKRRVRLPDRPRDIAIAGEAVWVATNRGRLVSIDPRSSETIRSIDLGGGSLSHVAAGGGAIWVTSYEDDAVFRVSATDLQPSELEVHQPARIAVNGRQVWLSAVDE